MIYYYFQWILSI